MFKRAFEHRIEDVKQAKQQLHQDIAEAKVGTQKSIESLTQELGRLHDLHEQAKDI